MHPFQIFILLYLLLNGWLVYRLWRALRGQTLLRITACLFTLILIVSLPVTYNTTSTNPVVLTLLWAGAFWIAWFSYALILTCCLDCFRLLNQWFNWWPKLSAQQPTVRYIGCAVIASVSLLISLLGWFNATQPVVREITLELPVRHTPPQSSLTVAALSDIHLGRLVSARHLNKLTTMIAPYQPDIVLFMGDIIDDRVGLDPVATRAAIQKLNPPLGIWGSLGNHEYISGDINEGINFIQQSGIHILRDDWVVSGGKLLLVGRDDYSGQRFNGHPRASLQNILDQVPIDKRQLPLIVMDHQPHDLEEAVTAGTSLQLSGHTHNGQIWPFNWVVARVYENSYGFSQKGNTRFWVSSGAGTWGAPVRTTGRPEILLIRIHFQPANDAAAVN